MHEVIFHTVNTAPRKYIALLLKFKKFPKAEFITVVFKKQQIVLNILKCHLLKHDNGEDLVQFENDHHIDFCSCFLMENTCSEMQ
jgi:hypothetical protein